MFPTCDWIVRAKHSNGVQEGLVIDKVIANPIGVCGHDFYVMVASVVQSAAKPHHPIRIIVSFIPDAEVSRAE